MLYLLGLMRDSGNVYKVELNQLASEVRLTPSDDLENFQWFTLSELAKIKLTPPASELLDRIGAGWLVK